jgi:thioredoxin 1
MNVIPVTAAEFEAKVINSKEPVLVLFTAKWSGPCTLMMPTLYK